MTAFSDASPQSYALSRAADRTEAADPTRLVKRSVVVAGHRTSVSLEDAFWSELRRVAAVRRCSINALIAEVDEGRSGNLSSAIRVFLLLNRVKED